jgi:hypothetical protein
MATADGVTHFLYQIRNTYIEERETIAELLIVYVGEVAALSSATRVCSTYPEAVYSAVRRVLYRLIWWASPSSRQRNNRIATTTTKTAGYFLGYFKNFLGCCLRCIDVLYNGNRAYSWFIHQSRNNNITSYNQCIISLYIFLLTTQGVYIH